MGFYSCFWFYGFGKMKNEIRNMVDDVLFMKGLGVSEDNIALLKRISVEDVEVIINSKKNSTSRGKKQNILREVANNNKWMDSPPSPRSARNIGENTWKDEEIDQQKYYETMTRPSKEIAKVDRSDRIGEDYGLELRLNNNVVNNNKKWFELVKELDDILDND